MSKPLYQQYEDVLRENNRLIAENRTLQQENLALRMAVPSLISFALAAPSNDASQKARDAAVEYARGVAGC